jgi:hypothetical protein
LWHLFKHEQQVILEQIFETTMREVEESFRKIYEDHFSLIRMLNENHMQLPKTLASVVEFVLQRDLLRLLEMQDMPLDKLARLVKEITRWPFKRDKENLDFVAGHKVNELVSRFAAAPDDIGLLEYIVEMVRSLSALKLELDVWKAQNIYYTIGKAIFRDRKHQAEAGNETSRRWVRAFEALGELLRVKVY